MPPRTVLCSACKRDLVTPDVPCYSSSRDILRFGWIPSDSDVSQNEHAIAEWSSNLAKYDAEIETLEGMLEELRSKKDEIQRYLDERRSLLSPVRKLPNEILGGIFAASCSDNGLLITAVPKGKISAPTLVLSHVCFLWREIIISTPSLWARMSVDLIYAVNERAQSLVKLYLTRSRPAPLTCKIEALDFSDFRDHGEVSPALFVRNKIKDDCLRTFFLFCSEVNRWQNVYLNLHSSFLNVCRRSGTAPLPLLETFGIEWEYGPRPYKDRTNAFLRSIVQNSPLLHNLVLSNFHDRFGRGVPLNHHQVTSLCIIGVLHENELGVVDIFRLFTHLEHLEIGLDRAIYLPSSEINDKVPHPQCHSSTLKTLVIKARSIKSSNRVISSLVLPSLRSLELSFDYKERRREPPSEVFSMQNLQNMLRHSPHIESFKLYSMMVIQVIDVLDLLAHIPSLTHLTIEADSVFFNDKFFLDMTLTLPSPAHSGPDEDRGLLPHLKSLDLTIWFLIYEEEQDPEVSNPKLIVDMVESRRNIRRQQHEASDVPDQTISEQPVTTTQTLNELCHFGIAASVEDTKLLKDQEWHESLSRSLRDRLRVHMDWGLSCTQDLGPF
ncbi:hypothetical protein K435DRAFT_730140 [Dendrothele bispora CBS 962.96]|uniref:Uncharacterized protein n=1 Tax=Dendrothele bispora (strain CBS 962.96) TaxID=1314807 RepID=A0A4S8LGM0_DENBC|nr:hypothetical protein K435DRAFT_730140 [Dendrothele bispora CBS 962.96]